MSTDSKADDSLQLTLVPGEPETSLMVSLPLDEIDAHGCSILRLSWGQ